MLLVFVRKNATKYQGLVKIAPNAYGAKVLGPMKCRAHHSASKPVVKWPAQASPHPPLCTQVSHDTWLQPLFWFKKEQLQLPTATLRDIWPSTLHVSKMFRMGGGDWFGCKAREGTRFLMVLSLPATSPTLVTYGKGNMAAVKHWDHELWESKKYQHHLSPLHFHT